MTRATAYFVVWAAILLGLISWTNNGKTVQFAPLAIRRNQSKGEAGYCSGSRNCFVLDRLYYYSLKVMRLGYQGF
jgi:hypothetical protein